MRFARAMASACACFILAACGGGTTLPDSARAGAPAAPQRTVRVPMHVKIPRMPRRARGRARRPYFVPATVAGIAVVVYRHASHLTPLGSVNADVSPSSPLCKTVSGGRDCTVAIPAPPGSDDFVVTAYDAAPSGGSFTGAKALATGEASATIATGIANVVAISLGGIVAGVAMSPAQLFVHAIAPSTQNLTVTAVDADGDAIVSDAYVDANGNPASIALAADSSAGTTVAFSPSSLASPAPSGVTVTYAASNATTAQVQNGFTSVLTASSGSLSATASLHAAVPASTPYSIPSGLTFPQFVATGSDRALWFTGSASYVGRATPDGAFSESGTLTGAANQISAGPDDAVWFTETQGAIGRIAIASPGSPLEVAPPPAVTLAQSITPGPPSDAASMWFTDPSDGLIGRIPTVNPTTASIAIYGPVAAMQEPGGIVAGSDGDLWFADCTAGAIGKIPPNSPAGTSATVTEFTIPATGGGSVAPDAIAAGPDGALWFTDPYNGTDGEIGRITTSGALSEYPTSSSSHAIVVGPDGALWFTLPNEGRIGRIDPVTHAIAEFPAGSYPTGLVLGPDEAIYVTDSTGNAIVRIQ